MDTINGLMSLAASAWSLAMIVLLCLSDAKSRRVAQRPVKRISSNLRRLVVILTLLPGALLLGVGASVAFLVWFGFVTLAGWGVAIALAPSAPDGQ